MKKILYTLFVLGSLTATLQAQQASSAIMITEFNYRSAMSPDSLEFVEIFNTTDSSFDLSAAKLQYGSTLKHTFPANTIIPSHGTIVLAHYPAVLARVYNMPFTPVQINTGAGSGLGNSGSTIILRTSDNTVLDSVKYTNNIADANAGGKTLMFCDLTQDNKLSSSGWAASAVQIFEADGVTARKVANKDVYGTPGYLDCPWGVVTPTLPANDECIDATLLTVGTTCTSVVENYENATQSMTPCQGTIANDVWYSFVATNDRMAINASTTTSDVVLQLFSGSCGSLTSIQCVNDVVNGVEDLEATSLIVGETYYVRVYDVSGSVSGTTTFEICVLELPSFPANDECSGAILLTQEATCTPTQGTVLNATESLSPCSPYSTISNDVWYSFVATSPNVTISVNNTDMDLAFEVLTGSCNALNAITCVDAGIVGDDEEVSFITLVAGQTYYVRVYENDDTPLNSTFDICITDYIPHPAPVNDECIGAIELIPSLNPIPLTYSIEGATQSMPEGNCDAAENYAADVWYSFVATDVTATINVQGVDYFDAIIEAFEGDCNNLNSIECADDTWVSASTRNVLETLTINTVVGETYYVRIYDYYGPFSVTNNYSISIVSLDPPTPINPCDTTNLVLTLDGCSASHEVSNVTGGVAPYSYEWSTGDTTASVTGLLVGNTYSVTVADVNGCTTTSTFLQEMCVGIGEVASGFNMNVYPNPAKEVAVLSLQTTNSVDLQIELVNVMGQVISSQAIVNQGKMTYNLPIENLTSGVYFVKVSSKEGVATQRLIIAK